MVVTVWIRWRALQIFLSSLVGGAIFILACSNECEEWPLGEPCDFSPGLDASSARLTIDPGNPQQLLTVEGDVAPLIGINRFNIYSADSNGGGLSTTEYLDLLRAQGITLVRVFVPDDDWLEPRIGELDETALNAVDRTLDAAWEYRLGVVLVLFDHYPLRHRWSELAWSDFGPESTAFLDNPDAVEAARRRADALVRRWHTHPAIAVWEPINELDGIHQLIEDGDPTLLDAALSWFETISAAIHEADELEHLVTGSLVSDHTWAEFWELDSVDIVQLHTYPGELDRREMANHITTLLNDHERYERPVWIGEIAIHRGSCRVPGLRSAVEVAAGLGSVAFVWNHVHDPFADVVPDELERIYGRARCSLIEEP
jgi:hypothetical protein